MVGSTATTDQVDQPTWRLGIAAYRFPNDAAPAPIGVPPGPSTTGCCGPKLKYCAAVSTNPYLAGIRRGGISG